MYLLLPGTSDHLLNLEHEPVVVVTTMGWQVRGRARELAPTEQSAAGALLERPDAPWSVVVECSPHVSPSPIGTAGALLRRSI